MKFNRKIASISLLLGILFLSGCAEISQRREESNVRHPCGNIFDVCPGDSQIIDVAARVLNGTN